MNTVAFTLWPWRVLALVVPAVAVVAGVACATDRQANPAYIAPAVLGVLGAGNAYILAIASGNLGRTVMAVPVGVIAGFLPLLVVAVPAALTVYVFILLLWGLGVAVEKMMRSSMAWGLLGTPIVLLLGGVLLLIALAGALRRTGDPAILAPLCFPFECACIVPCMTANTRYRGSAEAFCDSITASVKGLFAMIAIMTPLLIVFSILRVPHNDVAEMMLAILALMICNYFFMKNFFSAIVRDMPEHAKSLGP